MITVLSLNKNLPIESSLPFEILRGPFVKMGIEVVRYQVQCSVTRWPYDWHVVGGANVGTGNIRPRRPANVRNIVWSEHSVSDCLDEVVLVQFVQQVKCVATAHHDRLRPANSVQKIGSLVDWQDVEVWQRCLHSIRVLVPVNCDPGEGDK